MKIAIATKIETFIAGLLLVIIIGIFAKYYEPQNIQPQFKEDQLIISHGGESIKRDGDLKVIKPKIK